MVSPLERFRHGAVVLVDERQHFGNQVRDGRKVTTFEQFAGQDAQPDFHLVHPRGMLGRVVKDQAMGWNTPEGGACFHRFQNAAFPLDAQIHRQIGFVGPIANQGLRLMRVEIIRHAGPFVHQGGGFDGPLNVALEVLLGARRASGHVAHLPRGDFEVDDERPGASPDVLELWARHEAWAQGSIRMLAFQRLDAGHFIGTDHAFALFFQGVGVLIEMVDVFDFFVPVVIRFRRSPRAHPMGLEVRTFLKVSPHGTARWS